MTATNMCSNFGGKWESPPHDTCHFLQVFFFTQEGVHSAGRAVMKLVELLHCKVIANAGILKVTRVAWWWFTYNLRSFTNSQIHDVTQLSFFCAVHTLP